MTTTSLNIAINHNNSFCAGTLMELLRDAFEGADGVSSFRTDLDNVLHGTVVEPQEENEVDENQTIMDFVSVPVLVVDEQPDFQSTDELTVTASDTTHFYCVDVSINGGTVYSAPVSCFNGELETVSAMRSYMEENDILPEGGAVVGVDSINANECEEMFNCLSEHDPRYEDNIVVGTEWIYYSFLGREEIMSTKRIMTNEQAVAYAKQLGKIPMGIDAIISRLSKDEYFCRKYGADRKTSDWNYYSIELGEQLYSLQSKFLFTDDASLFEQFRRRGRVPSDSSYYGQSIRRITRETFRSLR